MPNFENEYQPLRISSSTLNDIGREMIRYSKKFDGGITYYIEEVRTGKKELALETLYKRKSKEATGNHADAEASPSLRPAEAGTSETTSPNSGYPQRIPTTQK